eukprot:scaffold101969_cov40-Phaeocystis_antarctica.AAC.2
MQPATMCAIPACRFSSGRLGPLTVAGARVRGLSVIVPRRAFRRGYIAHARTDVPALATFTVRQSTLRAVLP